jgi:hypothetical protein
MLFLLCAALSLAVAYAYFREGLMTAVTMMINVLLAGLITFNFYEPLAAEMESALAGSFLAGFEDALCLFGLFTLSLGALRAITHNLASSELALPPAVQQGGAALFGLLTGYLVVGFLMCLLQTLPLNDKFLGFESQVDPGGPGLRRVLPPDRVWLALMHRAGAGPFAQGAPSPFDPEGTFELRYARLRRVKEQ